MICPVCPLFVANLQILSAHIACDHGSLRKAIYRWKANGCNRLYDTFKSFKKHAVSCSYLNRKSSSDVSVAESSNRSVGVCESNPTPDLTFEKESAPHSASAFEDFVKASADEFVSHLYSMRKLPRSYVQTIMEHVTTLISKCCSKLKETVTTSLHECSAEEERICNLQNMWDVLSNPFIHISTEYRRLKYFKDSGVLIPPQSVLVGEMFTSKRTSDGNILHPHPCYVQSIPLETVFKKYLELPNVFPTVISYLEKLRCTSDLIENFMQCSLWKSKLSLLSMSPESLVLPIFVYFDEVECNNALGSRAKLLGAVYVSFPFLPPEFQSSVDNIFLALLFANKYRTEFGDQKVFAPLISQLVFLEKDGIMISTPSGDKQVFFVCSLILGDNKAVNSILGFMEGFTANYFCRFCKSHRNVTHTQTIEDVNTLRFELSHAQDLNFIVPEETGVKSDCVFNKLPSFHVTKNYSVDAFHDFFEGICHYVLVHLLNYFTPKYFSLDDLRNRIEFFDYGYIESNKIPVISSINVEKLKMSGSETLLFTRMLGLLIGDKVPEGNPHWLLYLKLRELLDIVLLKRVSEVLFVSLSVIVEEFNSTYVQVTKDTLKPKMHHLVHYARVLQNSGPIDLLSTRRFESKHRSITVPAHATSSRVDICKTAALSHQLHQGFNFVARKSLKCKFTCGPCYLVTLSNLRADVAFKNLPDCLTKSNELLSCDWLEIKGTKYKAGAVLIVNIKDGGPVFGQLATIIILNSKVYFMYEYLVVNGFNQHVHAYSVDFTSLGSCVEPDHMYDPLPLAIHHDINGEKYIVLRYLLI